MLTIGTGARYCRAISAAAMLFAAFLVGLDGLRATGAHRVADTSTTLTVRSSTPTAPVPPYGHCAGRGEKRTVQSVPLGVPARITLTTQLTCTQMPDPLDVVFVLEAAERMEEEYVRQMKEVALHLVDSLYLPEHWERRAAVIEFDHVARRLCDLTNDKTRVDGCINRVRRRGEADVAAGLREAGRLLSRRRPYPGVPLERHYDVVLLISQGLGVQECAPLLREAERLKQSAVLLATICIGPQCGAQCMRKAASSPRYFFQIQNASRIGDFFPRPERPPPLAGLRRLTVTDTLGAAMGYVPGSAEPAPRVHSEGHTTLEWSFSVWDFETDLVTMTYEVRALETGLKPANAAARALITTTARYTAGFTFPVPYVQVLPAPTATAAGTGTATSGPIRLPTASPTPSPVPTQDDRPFRLYCPVVNRG